MSVQRFDVWASKHVEHCQLHMLKDAVIGVDASYYLNLRLNGNNEEPLKHALGGQPFTFKRTIEEDITFLRQNGITLIFVFDGLDYVNKNLRTSQLAASRRVQDDAWHAYLNGDSKRTVADFGKATYDVDTTARGLQKLLAENNVEYMVAPYSATAQLSYLLALEDQFIDAVMGSTECFLFGMDRVVTDFNRNDSTLSLVSRATCEGILKADRDLLRDAQILLGTSFTPTFPILEAMATTKSTGVVDAIAMLKGFGNSVIQLCNYHRENAQVQNLKYADRYKKAIMTIRHHVVMDKTGVVAPLHFDEAPGDVHEFVGQRLPEELFFYLSKGMLAPEIPNWLTSGEVVLSLPGGVLDSEPYRRLVIELLNPFRSEALKILAESLHYYYQSRVIKVTPWVNQDTSNLTIEIRYVPAMKQKLAQWKVRGAQIESIVGKGEDASLFLPCLRSLKDAAFAKETITKDKVEHPALRTADEVVANAIFRYLQVRGYVDDQHNLTTWGKALAAALEVADEEYTIVGIEMLRMGLFTGNFASGDAVSKTDKDHDRKVNTNLISKIACLSRIQHKSMGFVGPLDRQLLTFAWKITAVRTTLRDLLETILTSMFLNGDVDREREDWITLMQKLPFASDNGSGNGIAVKTYLDAVNEEPEVTEALKASIKQQEGKYNWFAQLRGSGTLTKSLDRAWKVWDALYAATLVPGTEVKEAKLFSEVNEWLSPRR
ncbi:XPG I-region protein [Cladophialophora carrionii]|uniref:XPG I-region protein n=1 Tax=Cladophialophora carrionii TaxID=86049 RepID=A0A1C1C8T3_9EURO|nr:XPG I-region protein [Cladophialophora carrionii]